MTYNAVAETCVNALSPIDCLAMRHLSKFIIKVILDVADENDLPGLDGLAILVLWGCIADQVKVGAIEFGLAAYPPCFPLLQKFVTLVAREPLTVCSEAKTSSFIEIVRLRCRYPNGSLEASQARSRRTPLESGD
jgi:hypothetical protein